MFFEIVFAGIVLANVCNICAPFVQEKEMLASGQVCADKEKPAQFYKRVGSKIMIIPETAAMLITVPLFIACEGVSAGMMSIERKIKRARLRKR